MPVTRSITRTRATTTAPAVNLKRAPNKRQLEEADLESDSAATATTKRKKSSSSSNKSKAKPELVEAPPRRPLARPPSEEDLAPLPAKLTFSLEDAKDHLIKADRRFGDVFSRLPCKPFERLEGIHPFRSVSFFFLLFFCRRVSHTTARPDCFDHVNFNAERCALP